MSNIIDFPKLPEEVTGNDLLDSFVESVGKMDEAMKFIDRIPESKEKLAIQMLANTMQSIFASHQIKLLGFLRKKDEQMATIINAISDD